jgi:hypothetical protein
VSITISKGSDDLFVITIQGVYTYDDQKQIENYATEPIDPERKVKILVFAQEFAGWGKEGDWGDLSFMYKADPYITHIAIVADEKWKEQMLMFAGAGRRQADIEFFFPDEVEEARQWLQEKINS